MAIRHNHFGYKYVKKINNIPTGMPFYFFNIFYTKALHRIAHIFSRIQAKIRFVLPFPENILAKGKKLISKIETLITLENN